MPEYQLRGPAQRLRVQAQAPGHRFEVSGAGLTGTFRLEAQTLEAASITLELASLSAGDRLRDHELRRFLELDRDPRAQATLLAPAALSATPAGALSGRGRFLFEIGSRRTEAEVSLSGEARHPRASLALSFSGLGWKPPRLLLLSVKDTLLVEVQLQAEEITPPGV